MTKLARVAWALALALSVLGMLLPALGAADGAPGAAPEASDTAFDAASDAASDGAAAAQLERGAALFAANCAVCHGATGAGYDEARQAFPPDHRRCTRCHRPSNRAVMSLEEITDDHDLFSLGEPPALRGDGALAAFASAEALAAYIGATMPRYEPGRLTADEYLDLTAWLLQLNGRLPAGVPLTRAALSDLGAP